MRPAAPLRALPLLALAAGCSSGEARELSPLALEGKQVYENVCIACHHGNPSLDGAIGPASTGASEELLAAKILRGEYPPGYTPKRPGSIAMPRFPELEGDIPALAAYLSELEEERE